MQPMSPATPDEPELTEEAPAAEAHESGDYTICVTCKADGSFEVYKETEHEEADTAMPNASMPMMGEGEPMPGSTSQPETFQANSLEDALKHVIRIHKQNPMDQSYAGQMSAGFQGEHREPY